MEAFLVLVCFALSIASEVESQIDAHGRTSYESIIRRHDAHVDAVSTCNPFSFSAPGDFGGMGSRFWKSQRPFEFLASDGFIAAQINPEGWLQMVKFTAEGTNIADSGRFKNVNGVAPTNAAQLVQYYEDGTNAGSNYIFNKGSRFGCSQCHAHFSFSARDDFGGMSSRFWKGQRPFKFLASDGFIAAQISPEGWLQMVKFTAEGTNIADSGRFKNVNGVAPTNAAQLVQYYEDGTNAGSNYIFNKGTGFRCTNN